jgi:hypothetical protein
MVLFQPHLWLQAQLHLLATGHRLNCICWTPLQMPAKLIEHIHALATQHGNAFQDITFADRHGETIQDPDNDDDSTDNNDDKSYDPNDDPANSNDDDAQADADDTIAGVDDESNNKNHEENHKENHNNNELGLRLLISRCQQCFATHTSMNPALFGGTGITCQQLNHIPR